MCSRLYLGTSTVFLSAATLCGTQPSIAQQCGTEVPPEGIEIVRDRMALGQYELPPFLHLDPVAVRIKWHVVTSSLGTRCIDDDSLSYYLEGITSAFTESSLQFCADTEVHLIIDDELYENVASHYHLRMIEPTEDALDIYWCPSLSNGALCGTSSYSFGPPIQGIAIQTTCMGYTDVLGVLIHEVGHYFDLLHTHEMGWGIECPVGGDCANEGDLVCDTVPGNSLQFETCVNPLDCSFVNDDPSCLEGPPPPICDGSPYPEPDVLNYMSYAPVPCLTAFSSEQMYRARATYDNFRTELHEVTCITWNGCFGDINQDGEIDGGDLAALLSLWGSDDFFADIDGDGIVGGSDLSIILANWNACNQ